MAGGGDWKLTARQAAGLTKQTQHEQWESGLPVRVLRAHVHLEEDPLGESLKALPAFPEMPVTELRVQLACGSWAGEDPLVFHVDLVKS